MRRSTKTAGLAVTLALAGVGWAGLAGGSAATAQPHARAQAADPTLAVKPPSGAAGTPFSVTGTGCDGGFGIVRVDGKALMFQPDRGGGTWTVTTTFPSTVGSHTISAGCYDQTTAGAPTTFYGPGDLRFTYDDTAVETTTTATADTEPLATQPPVTRAPQPAPAAPATPAPAKANYTG